MHGCIAKKQVGIKEVNMGDIYIYILIMLLPILIIELCLSFVLLIKMFLGSDKE